MFNALTQQAREVMTLAAGESRRLGHEYVGTEHILLALSLEPSFARSGVLTRVGLHPDVIRTRVDALVQPGPTPHGTGGASKAPLTPRAARAIQMAKEEAANVSLPLAGPEHLLIGLIREPDGVAGVVMRQLGLDELHVRSECLRVRLRQMQVVERAVRPVQATVGRKRHMREELLAHLTAACEQEQRDGEATDALVALGAAAKRFGDPAELARELQASVPRMERLGWHIEHWLGWRAPESVLRMLSRTAFISFGFIAICAIVSVAAGVLISPDVPEMARVLGVLVPLALLTPAAQFGFGWCYYKARDSLWGAFGAKRSLSRASAWSVAGGLVVFLCGLGFILGIEGRSSSLMTVRVPSMLAAGVVAAITCAVLARMRGPAEIRDTTWSLLPVDSAC